MGLLLLSALCGLQLAHFVWLYLDLDWVSSAVYRVLLFAVAPSFYLFSQPLLSAGASRKFSVALLWHMLPAGLALALPSSIALPVAFAVGAVYLVLLARSVYALRSERIRFAVELKLLGAVFLIALCVAALGLVQSLLPSKWFFAVYATAIGFAFVFVQMALALRPQLSVDVSEVAQAAYVSTTLANVNCEEVLAKLQSLMVTEKLYTDAELSLSALAKQLEVSTHQLSELINSRLGKGLSRYLREVRIEAAKTMLRDEPSASVLSVGLNVGFSSQSNFYEAFREIEGSTPGQYRKLAIGGKQSP